MLEAYARHPEAFTSTPGERGALPLRWWEERLQLGPATREVVFGAFAGDQLAGAAGLTFEPREKTRHKATLFGMYVRPEHRKLGLGRELVTTALEHAKARDGLRVVQLTVTHGNAAAQELYERCGFVPFGLEPYAIADGAGFVSKVHLWCDLGASLGVGATRR